MRRLVRSVRAAGAIRAIRVRLCAARKVAPALMACVLAVALVFGGLRSGAHYFFCAGMGSLAEKPCCAPPAPAAGEHDDAPFESAARSSDDDDCCERLDLGRLPEASGGTAAEPIRSAPLVAVLAPVDLAARELGRLPSLAAPTRRAGASPPPTAPERCALSAVFLI